MQKSRLHIGLKVHEYMKDLDPGNQTTKWKSFVTTQLNKTYTKNEKQRCKRAWNEWKTCTHDGAYIIQTVVGINAPMRMSSGIDRLRMHRAYLNLHKHDCSTPIMADDLRMH